MTRRLPGLDALRGLAAAWVVVYHATLRGLLPPTTLGLNGWMGVDLFFALSGYLLAVQHADRPPLVEWLARRARRLLPMHLVLLLGAGLPLWWMGRLDPLASTGPSSMGAFPSLRVLWSLAVEYHAYLLLPLVLRRRWRTLGLLAVVGLGPLARAYAVNEAAAATGVFCRLDGLAWGALAAAWAPHQARAPWWTGVVLDAAAGGLLSVHVDMHAAGWSVPGFTVSGLVAALLVVEASTWSTAPAWMRWLGRVSFSLYLLHEVVFDALGGLLPVGVLLVGAVGVAGLAERFVERPFQRGGGGRAVAMGEPSSMRSPCALSLPPSSRSSAT